MSKHPKLYQVYRGVLGAWVQVRTGYVSGLYFNQLREGLQDGSLDPERVRLYLLGRDELYYRGERP